MGYNTKQEVQKMGYDVGDIKDVFVANLNRNPHKI